MMTSLIESQFSLFKNKKGGWSEALNKIEADAARRLYRTKVANHHSNEALNRYRNVLPCDTFRVKLEGPANDYINASHVRVIEANREYILTQGPLESTSSDFWLMVWQQKSKGIVMLNNLIEKGRKKCHPYYPSGCLQNGEKPCFLFEDVKMRVTLLSEKTCDGHVLRNLELKSLESGEERSILHFHYTDWPDFDVPSSTKSFLLFHREVKESGVVSTEGSPPVIHCSAGIGRSGAFCLVDSVLALIEKTQSLHGIDPLQIVLDMRKYRAGIIQTPEQLRFCYDAILDGSKQLIEQGAIPAHIPDKVLVAPAIPQKRPSSSHATKRNASTMNTVTSDETKCKVARRNEETTP